MNYLESLKKGNQTLTEKIERLTKQLLTVKGENFELQKENYALKYKVKELEEQVKKLSIPPKRYQLTLDGLVKLNSSDMLNLISEFNKK